MVLLAALFIGPTAPAAEPLLLRAGPLTMVFEPDNASLRYVKLGSDEVLHGISAPVRNQFWGTVRPDVSHVKLDNRGDHFSLTFDARCRERDIDFLWRGTLRGGADGQVEFTFDGRARSTFLRNRIGFCLLHGPTAAGRPWVLETTKGEKSKGQFPVFIAPHQPAKDLRAVAHEFAPGRWAHVRFEGEIFEMEDQRNWTDASFKTYCTPLALSYPVRVTKGTKILQKITLRLEGTIPKGGSDAARDSRVLLSLGTEQSPLPRIGLQTSSQVDELSAAELNRLRSLHLDHLRVDLTPAQEGFARKLRQAADQAKALEVRLHVGLHLSKMPGEDLKKLAAELERVHPPVSLWLVLGTNGPVIRMAREALKPYQGDAWFGVGEDTYFTELNRNRPEANGIDAVSYALTPQVHAFDNASMVETLPIQGDTVRSARQFVGDRPLVIGPVTLRPQLINQEPLPGELPSNVEPRQPSLFAAGWTLGSVKYLSEAGVHSITYFETVGWKGIMESERVTGGSNKFPARPGELFAVYHVLRGIGEFAGGRVQRVESTDAQSVVGMALNQGGRQRLLVANLTDRPQAVALRGFDGKIEVRQLTLPGIRPAGSVEAEAWGERSAGPLTLEAPLVLPPHGLARIDRVGE